VASIIVVSQSFSSCTELLAQGTNEAWKLNMFGLNMGDHVGLELGLVLAFTTVPHKTVFCGCFHHFCADYVIQFTFCTKINVKNLYFLILTELFNSLNKMNMAFVFAVSRGFYLCGF